MVAPYMTRIKLPATWTYMYEKLVNISAWYMVQCNNYQSVHLRYVRTGTFVFSAILFCVLRYCCAVVPSSKKIAGCKCQVMADSPKRNSLVWPGQIRFWLFRCFSLSDKATEIQSKQKESNVSEKKDWWWWYQSSPWQTTKLKQRWNILNLNKMLAFKNLRCSGKVVNMA